MSCGYKKRFRMERGREREREKIEKVMWTMDGADVFTKLTDGGSLEPHSQWPNEEVMSGRRDFGSKLASFVHFNKFHNSQFFSTSRKLCSNITRYIQSAINSKITFLLKLTNY